MKRIALKIEGMHCAGCVVAIQDYLSDIDGIKSCQVNLASNKAMVEYDPSKVSIEDIEKAISDVGYKVVYESISLRLKDINEVDAGIVESKLKHDAIKHVSVNHATKQVYLEYNPALLSLQDIRNMIQSLGYEIVSEDVKEYEDHEVNKLKRLLMLGIIFSIPVMLYSYGNYLTFLPFSNTTISSYIIFVSASIIQVALGSRFYLGAYKIARLRGANMDTLVALGTTAAYLFSIYNLLQGSDVLYFDASSIILTFVILGKYMENKMKSKASSIIRKLLELQPKTARVIKGNEEQEVPIELVKKGDLVLIKPGEKVPVDGVIVDGYTSIDESMVTGEYMPVSKKEGDNVIGGTINKEGSIIVRVTKNKDETFLAQISGLIEEAMSKKPQMQRLVDKISGYFAFIVIMIASITFLSWLSISNLEQAILASAAILVVACPCALGLATPTAIMVGMSKSAQHGVIFKSGEALELLARINTVVFDKTGTLTKGKLEVTDIMPILKAGMDSVEASEASNELLAIAATAEYNSEHPIGDAIVRKAKELRINFSKPDKFRAIAGRGVKAIHKDNTILVGSIDFIISNGIDIRDADKHIQYLQKQGKTAVLVAKNKELLGIIGVFDTPRDEARHVIARLKSKGIKCIMLTGDNYTTASVIAKELGIDEVKAEVLPDDKVYAIKELQKQEGKKVAMVGDGINDAPALIQADLGIAIASASDITLEAGDVILIRNNLKDLINAIEISSKTISKVKQNIVYAFGYNIILIPLAAFGLLYPALAGMAMAASSVSVTASSLLLKRYKPKE